VETLQELARVDLGKDGGMVGNANGYGGQVGGGGLREDLGVVPGEVVVQHGSELGKDVKFVDEKRGEGCAAGEDQDGGDDSEEAPHGGGTVCGFAAGGREGFGRRVEDVGRPRSEWLSRRGGHLARP